MKFISEQVEKFTPDNFFIWMRKFYMFNGFLPPKNRIFRHVYIVFATAYFSLLVLELISQWLVIFINFDQQDLCRIMIHISLSIFSSIIDFRIAAWLILKHKMGLLIDIVTRPSFNFECFRISRIYLRKINNQSQEDDIQNITDYYNKLSDSWNENGIIHISNGM